jgi:hypothetical protein
MFRILGSLNAQMPVEDATFFRYPHRFVEKQVLAIELKDGFVVESDRYTIPFTTCEVYAPRGIMTEVCIS